MKKVFPIIVAVLLTASVFAQSPEKMSYQAVIRNSSDILVTNTQIGMQISILQGSASGTAVYVETQTPTSNANGLVSLEIGTGTVVSGNFSTIDWANDSYFIKTETDPTGGTSYSITGTSQLLSVPYALHAKTAETVTGGISETDPVYSASEAANINATDITNLGNLSGVNTGDQDLSTLATKTALGDSTAQVRSEIPDVSGFLTTETDPVYIGSQAANITATDITNLGNLSGVNTGDQDGSETKVIAGTNVTVSGAGTTASPYVVRTAAGTTAGDMQYWNGTAWITVAAGNEGQMLIFDGGVPTWTTVVGITTVHLTDVYNPSTGEVWMDRNLGASQVATSSTDAAAYGDLYQWGRAADGHQIRTSGTTATLATSDTPGHGDFITIGSGPYDWRNPQNGNLWQNVSGTNNPCPGGYRLPTEVEWVAERTSWSSYNAVGAFASPLKLPVAAARFHGSGEVLNVGSVGYYWSSTVVGSYTKNLTIDTHTALIQDNRRANGLSVRCLKD